MVTAGGVGEWTRASFECSANRRANLSALGRFELNSVGPRSPPMNIGYRAFNRTLCFQSLEEGTARAIERLSDR
jgi:hypothetical protein